MMRSKSLNLSSKSRILKGERESDRLLGTMKTLNYLRLQAQAEVNVLRSSKTSITVDTGHLGAAADHPKGAPSRISERMAGLTSERAA
jgi:hypothetical protein